MISTSLTGDRRARRQLALGAALVAPVLMVVAGRFVIGLSPAESQAAAPVAVTTDEPPAVQPLSPAQRKLVTYLSVTAGSLPPLNSPMDQIPAPVVPVRAPVEIPPTPADTVAVPAIPARPDIPLVLSGVMAGTDPTSALVMISGKVFRAGDEVAPGWVIIRIDPRALSVTLRGTENQEFTLVRDQR